VSDLPEPDVGPESREERRLRRQYLHAFVAAAAVGPFLSYVLADLGWSPRYIGYATAALTASAVITAPAWGWLDDLTDGAAAHLSLLTTAAASLLVMVSATRLGTGVTIVSIGVLGSASGSIEPLLTSRMLRDPRTAARLGTTRSLGSVGWILGLGLGGLLLTVSDRSVLVFLIAAVAALTTPRPSRTAHDATELGARDAVLRPRPPLRAVLWVLSLTFPIPLCMAALVYFTAGWARDLGATPLVAVGPLALAASLELPAFVLVDRLARRLSPISLCVLAFPPLAAASATLAILPSRGALYAVQPLVAMSFTLWFVSQSQLVAARVETTELASALALVATLGRGVAGPVAGIAGGTLAAAGGYPSLFLAMAVVCTLGFLRVLLPAWQGARTRERSRL
jgi:MFS family permease